jgi:hypothetical protein
MLLLQKATMIGMLFVSSVHCFSSLNIASSPPTRITVADRSTTTTQLAAVSIPIPAWGGAVGVGSTTLGRRDRTQQVLAQAKSRTGVPVYTPTQTITLRKLGEQATSTTAATQQQQQQGTLPFTLPQLSEQQLMALQAGEIVQEQSEMGRQGSGFVVQDVGANEETLWNCLLDVDSYVENIRTVRSMRRTDKSSSSSSTLPQQQQPVKFGTPGTIRACFTVSKFQLQIGTVLKYQPAHAATGGHHYMELTLDNDFSNAVLQSAKGIWYTQRISSNVTRLWLLCDLTVSPLLPPFIVDSTAASAMPHASTWIRPAVAKAQAAAATAATTATSIFA